MRKVGGRKGSKLIFFAYCQSRQTSFSLWTSKNLFDALVPKQLHDVVNVTRTGFGRNSVALRLEWNDLIINEKLAQPFPGQPPLHYRQFGWLLGILLSAL